MRARGEMERKGVVVVGSHVQGLFMRVSRFPSPDQTVAGWDYGKRSMEVKDRIRQ